MEVLDNEFAASKAPSMTLEQALESAKAYQTQQVHEKPVWGSYSACVPRENFISGWTKSSG